MGLESPKVVGFYIDPGVVIRPEEANDLSELFRLRINPLVVVQESLSDNQFCSGITADSVMVRVMEYVGKGLHSCGDRGL